MNDEITLKSRLRPLRIEEVASVYGRPVSFVEAWITSGRLPAMRIGGNILVRWPDVIEQYCGVPAVSLDHPDVEAESIARAKAARAEQIERQRLAQSDAGQAELRRREVKRNVCYFIHAPSVSLVKIGSADNPYKRFCGLRTMSPVPLTVLCLMPGYAATEREMHSRFQNDRRHGEWFAASPQILRHAGRMRTLYGLPDWTSK